MRFEFKQILMIVVLSYGLLFAFSAIGLLRFVTGLIPITGSLTVGGVTYPPIPAILAIMVVAVFATLIATAITEGMDNKRAWTIFLAIAAVSAALWIFAPQFLPKELQFLAGSAQSVITGHMPTQALLSP